MTALNSPARQLHGTQPRPRHFTQDAENGPAMKLLVYAFLFIAAAVLVIGLVIGLAFKLIGFAVAALLVVAGVTWVMNKIRGPKPPVERLTR